MINSNKQMKCPQEEEDSSQTNSSSAQQETAMQ
jgi:hypothetical protein